MAGETEIRRLVVRLVGDAVSYQQMLQQAIQSTDKAADSIEQAGTRIEKIQATLSKFGSQMVIAGASMDRMFGGKIQAIRDKGLAGFAEAEAAEFRLASAIKAHGDALEPTMKRAKEFAAEMQKTTTAEDDAVIAALAVARGMGVYGAAAEKAIAQAQGLAATTPGGNIGQFIRETSLLSKGFVTRGLSIQLGMKGVDLEGVDDAEKAAKAHELLNLKIRASKDETQIYQGQLKQMNNEVGNAEEIIGKFVADGWRPLNAAVRDAARWFQELSPEVHQATASMMAFGANIGSIVSGAGNAALGINSLIMLANTSGTAFMAMKLGVAGIGLAAVAVTGQVLYNLTPAVQDFNRELQKSIMLSDLARGKRTAGSSQVLVEASGMDGEAREKFLAGAVKQAKAELQGYEKQLTQAQGRQDALWESTWNPITAIWGAEATSAKQSISEIQQKMSDAQSQITQLEAAAKQASPEVIDRKADKALEEYIASQQKSIMLARETNEIEKEMMDLRAANVPEEGIEKARAAAQEKLSVLNKERQMKALNAEIGRQAAEEESAAIEEYNQQLAQGKALAEQLLTPQEKLVKTQEDLQKLLEVIGPEFKPTYDRALKKAKDEASGLKKEIKDTHSASQSLQASLWGSAEAISRWQEMRIQGTSERFSVPEAEGASPAEAPRFAVMGETTSLNMPQSASPMGGFLSPETQAAWSQEDLAGTSSQGFLSPEVSTEWNQPIQGTPEVSAEYGHQPTQGPLEGLTDQYLKELLDLARRHWKEGGGIEIEMAGLTE